MGQIAPHVGIDVSQDRLDVAIFPDGGGFAVANTPAGWAELTQRCLALHAVSVGLETSGGLEHDVACALQDSGLSARLLNAFQVRNFARALGRLAKNDWIDAAVIARFIASVPGRPLAARSAVHNVIRCPKLALTQSRCRWDSFAAHDSKGGDYGTGAVPGGVGCGAGHRQGDA